MRGQEQKDCVCKQADDGSLELLLSDIRQLRDEVAQMRVKLFTGNGKNALTTDVELLHSRLDELCEDFQTHRQIHDKEAKTRLWFISLLVTALLTLFTAFYMTESPSEKRYNAIIEELQTDMDHNKAQLNLILEKLANLNNTE